MTFRFASSDPDTDGDGVWDGQDALPTNAEFAFARVEVPSYALVPLGVEGTVVDANRAGELVTFLA